MDMVAEGQSLTSPLLPTALCCSGDALGVLKLAVPNGGPEPRPAGTLAEQHLPGECPACHPGLVGEPVESPALPQLLTSHFIPIKTCS